MKGIISHFHVRFPKWTFSWMLLLIDSLIGFFAYRISLESNIIDLGVHPIWGFILLQLFWSFLFLFRLHFQGEFTVSRVHEIKRIAQTTLAVVFLFIVINAIINPLPWIPAESIFGYWFQFYFGITIAHFIVRSFQKHLLLKGIGQENSLILGVNPRGILAAQILSEHQQQGYKILGFVHMSDDRECTEKLIFPILGKESMLHDIIVNHQITEVIFALEKIEHDRLLLLLNTLNGLPVSSSVVPALQDVISGLIHTKQLHGLPLLKIQSQLNTSYNRYGKRLVDLLITIPALIVSLPIALLTGLLIKLGSHGPIIYSQKRVGKNGTLFSCYKFRSMREDAEKHTGPVWSEEGDPRVTVVGKWLRRFRIDELPQLVNVLKGEMSLIGPRPERPYFVEKLKKEIPLYARRFNVRPGITGWAQIKQPADRVLDDVREKLRYDFYYLENLSFNIDIKIILSTIWVMFSGKGR